MLQMGFQTRTLYYAIAAHEASLIKYKESSKPCETRRELD